MMSIKKEAILIKCAIYNFITNDWPELMKLDVHEVTMAHRIGVYLEEKFREYNIDLEYNRDKANVKRNMNGSNVRPDIIIHKRNSDNNLCIFEIKKNSIDSKDAKNDIKKLKNEVKKYNYKLGVFLGITAHRINICWIERNSKEIIEFYEVIGS